MRGDFLVMEQESIVGSCFFFSNSSETEGLDFCLVESTCENTGSDKKNVRTRHSTAMAKEYSFPIFIVLILCFAILCCLVVVFVGL